MNAQRQPAYCRYEDCRCVIYGYIKSDTKNTKVNLRIEYKNQIQESKKSNTRIKYKTQMRRSNITF